MTFFGRGDRDVKYIDEHTDGLAAFNLYVLQVKLQFLVKVRFNYKR